MDTARVIHDIRTALAATNDALAGTWHEARCDCAVCWALTSARAALADALQGAPGLG